MTGVDSFLTATVCISGRHGH